MVEASDFVRFWGDELVRLPLDSTQELRISKECKAFLAEVGLPSMTFLPGATPGFILLPPDGLQSRSDEADPTLLQRVGPFRLLAATSPSEFSNYIALDEKNGGRVVYHTYNNLSKSYAFFLNSTVVQFVQFLLIYNTWAEYFYPDWTPRSVEGAQDLETLSDKLHLVDPAALSPVTDDRGEVTYHYWGNILQEFQEIFRPI